MMSVRFQLKVVSDAQFNIVVYEVCFDFETEFTVYKKKTMFEETENHSRILKRTFNLRDFVRYLNNANNNGPNLCMKVFMKPFKNATGGRVK